MSLGTSTLSRTERRASTPRRGLAVAAAAVAISAYAGAIGLATGAIDFGTTIDRRLPFDSLGFGGCALALVVGAPFTVLAWLAARGDERTDRAAVFAGALLIGWIVVELAFIRALSFLHPACVVVGAAFVWVGRRASQSSE